MIFTTFQFVIFYVVVFGLYFLLPRSARHPLLLAASYYFYMCSVPWYLTVIIAITLIDFFTGIKMEEARSHAVKRFYLILSLVSNLGILITFKYAAFFASNINDVLGIGLPVLKLILPLGISFHTFQAVSYSVEVYRGRVPAERSLMRYSLYVAFFPQMVAGPIERPGNLLTQFHTDHTLNYDRFRSGLQMVLWGLFKKVAVADLVAPVVSTVYAAPEQFSGPVLILATVLFAVQIYGDFSGYTDIAIGVARMMGYDLMINFRQPYFSKSVGEFWRRWHISLSTWFRDYLYIPLGGSRAGPLHRHVNIFIVFLVSGFWHGANWTFLAWGALHGFYLVVGSLTEPIRARIGVALGLKRLGPVLAISQVLTTFALVTIAWVFFRAANIHDAVHIIKTMPNWSGFHLTDIFTLGLPRFEMALVPVMISTVIVTEWLQAYKPAFIIRLWSLRPFRWLCYFACGFAIIFFGVFEKIEFIYFQF